MAPFIHSAMMGPPAGGAVAVILSGLASDLVSPSVECGESGESRRPAHRAQPTTPFPYTMMLSARSLRSAGGLSRRLEKASPPSLPITIHSPDASCLAVSRAPARGRSTCVQVQARGPIVTKKVRRHLIPISILVSRSRPTHTSTYPRSASRAMLALLPAPYPSYQPSTSLHVWSLRPAWPTAHTTPPHAHRAWPSRAIPSPLMRTPRTLAQRALP
jgi:hypothetical protein